MPLDLSDTFVVGITATALFDLSDADSLFRKVQQEQSYGEAVRLYRDFMAQREEEDLDPGTGFPLIKALLELNTFDPDPEGAPLVEVVVMSRNSPETGIRVFHNIRKNDLDISRSAFTGGESVTDYLDAFDVDLFLTTNVHDARTVSDSGYCAVALLKDPPENTPPLPEDHVRIAFDGDAVLFNEQSEIMYKEHGLEEFHAVEDAEQDKPMEDGPHANLLRKLARLQERLPHQVELSPVRLAIVTARNSPAEMRVLKTLRHWNIYIDEIFFLGGLTKTKVLQAFNPHIFFDDQERHLTDAAKFVPTAKVPYKSDSQLAED